MFSSLSSDIFVESAGFLLLLCCCFLIRLFVCGGYKKSPQKFFKTLFSTLVFSFFRSQSVDMIFLFFFSFFPSHFFTVNETQQLLGESESLLFFRNMFKFQNLTAAETMSKIQNESIG